MDLNKLWVNDSGDNEDTICLVNKWMGVVFWAYVHERVPLNSQWLVLRIGGTNFLHCWVADSTAYVQIFEGCKFRGWPKSSNFIFVDLLLSHLVLQVYYNCFIKFRGFKFRGWQINRENSKIYFPRIFVCIRYIVRAC